MSVNVTVYRFSPTILLLAVTAAAFAGSFHGDFQYDDSLTILDNPHVELFHTFISHLDHMVRPVLYATFLVDRSLYGLNPVGYHLLNLLLHLGSGLLLYRILTNVVPDEAGSIPSWTALLFLIHPIVTETVTYISGRASGLMAFFYLLSLSLYIKTSQQPDRSLPLLSAAIASFLLSIGSKETAVTLPLVLLLWDRLIRGKRGHELRASILANHSPFWIVLLIATAWAWSHSRYTALAEVSFTIRPFWNHLLSQAHAMVYAGLLFFTPWNQNFDHDLPVFDSPAQYPLPLDLLLLAAMGVGAFIARRRLPLVTFGIAWFFIQFLPTCLIPRNDLLSERNLYLPAIGLLLAIVALALHLVRRLNTIIRRPDLVRFGSAAVAVTVVLVLCLCTYQRNQLYQDRLLLWSDAVRKSPNKARPHNNLGYAYSLHGDWERAIQEFRRAAQLDPDFLLAQQNLRDAYLRQVGRE